MKKIISLLLVVLPLLFMLSCDRNNPTSTNPNPNSDGSNTTSFTVRFTVIQKCNQGGDEVIVNDIRNVTWGWGTGQEIQFSTNNCKEGATFSVSCLFEWNNYTYYCNLPPTGYCNPYVVDYVISDLNNNNIIYEQIGANCPPQEPIPPVGVIQHGPCSNSGSLTLNNIALQKNTTYKYRLNMDAPLYEEDSK